MKPTTWNEEAPGRLRISLKVPIAGRLFGVPFVAAGGYFAWQAAGAVADALRPGTGITLGSALPGAIALLAMALVFGIPGLLLALFRSSVVIDAAEGSVREEKDFRLFRKAAATPLSELVRVRACRETAEHKDGDDPNETYQTTLWTVLLDRKKGAPLTAAVVEGAEEARALAGRASRLANVPMVDETA